MGSKGAVIVLSGGQDSTTCLMQALREYESVHCITFNYGQRHKAEIDVARSITSKLDISSHSIIDVDAINTLSVSSLTRRELKVPTFKSNKGEVPNTFVPGRNIVFLTFASIFAYQIQVDTVITGVSQTDFSGYPDCRENFIKSLNTAVSLGIGKNLIFKTPLMNLSKAETWALADMMGEMEFIRDETLTCYNGIKSSGCGKCDACHLRAKGLEEYLNNKEEIKRSLLKKQASLA